MSNEELKERIELLEEIIELEKQVGVRNNDLKERIELLEELKELSILSRCQAFARAEATQPEEHAWVSRGSRQRDRHRNLWTGSERS
jgi:hypothetical protein